MSETKTTPNLVGLMKEYAILVQQYLTTDQKRNISLMTDDVDSYFDKVEALVKEATFSIINVLRTQQSNDTIAVFWGYVHHVQLYLNWVLFEKFGTKNSTEYKIKCRIYLEALTLKISQL